MSSLAYIFLMGGLDERGHPHLFVCFTTRYMAPVITGAPITQREARIIEAWLIECEASR